MVARTLIVAVVMVCLAGTSAAQNPEPGVSSELAVERAELVSNVEYALEFDLRPGAGRTDIPTVAGAAKLTFDLPEKVEQDTLILDFGEDCALDESLVNAVPVELARVANHLLVPGPQLVSGTNVLELRFRVRAAPAGTPLITYEDRADGETYWYTLTVPADAHRLYPCFDQPDLKARFDLVLTTPRDHVAVSNGAEANGPGAENPDRPREREDGGLDWAFARTAPISTYLFAFASGPFDVVLDGIPSPIESEDGDDRLRMFVRRSRRDDLDTDLLFGKHRAAVAWLADYFGIAYPFSKLDFVLLPGFPYGGMEHAGAIFYRESALVFDHAPTESELLRRSSLIYHEVSHQWFGNLVTMKWFDDLWLKEGFATFVAYTLVEALEPDRRAWLRFHQRVKPGAYAVDRTRGTVPIQQTLQNLSDAKSAYGPIVYNKAPAVLRQLQSWLGAATFQAGMQRFLRTHAYGNATWEDLVDAFEIESKRDGSSWSNRWIRRPGLPRVSVEWSVAEDGSIDRFEVRQSAASGDAGAASDWPLDLEILLFGPDGASRTHRVVLDVAVLACDELYGEQAPVAVLLNPRDIAYGLFVLDPASTRFFLSRARQLDDPLQRAVAFAALRETMRAGRLAPDQFADCVVEALESERDAATFEWLLARAATTLGRYLPEDAASARRVRLTDRLVDRLTGGELVGRELETFRFLARDGDAARTRELIEGVLSGERQVDGLVPGIRDMFLAAASRLAASGDSTWIDRLVERSSDEDTGKMEFTARAANPDPTAKQRVFATYVDIEGDDAVPEQWVQDSLDNFHWRGQSQVTLAFLRRALERVDWVKRNRKIFFMPAWIDAFVNGHSSASALEIVETWLAETKLEDDVRRKVLQSVDELRLAVQLRGAADAESAAGGGGTDGSGDGQSTGETGGADGSGDGQSTGGTGGADGSGDGQSTGGNGGADGSGDGQSTGGTGGETAAASAAPIPLSHDRHGHQLERLPDGTLLVFGGFGSPLENPVDRGTRETWALPPGADAWQRRADLTWPLTFAGSTLLDGTVYGIGDGVQRYDAEADRWQEIIARGTLPGTHFGSARVGRRVYVIGGHPGREPRGAFVVDLVEHSVEAMPPMPGMEDGDHFHICHDLGGELHVFGGLGQPGPLARHLVYDGAAWREASPPPTGLWGKFAVQATDGARSWFATEQAALSYELESDTWSEIARYDEAVADTDGRFRYVVLPQCWIEGSSLYALGGVDAGERRPMLLRYDIERDRWDDLASR